MNTSVAIRHVTHASLTSIEINHSSLSQIIYQPVRTVNNTGQMASSTLPCPLWDCKELEHKSVSLFPDA